MMGDDPLPQDDPWMIAWGRYIKTERFANALRWAQKGDHVDCALWDAFEAGHQAADALEWQPIADAPEDLEFMLVGHWHPMAGWSPAIVSQSHVRRLKEGGDMGPRFYFMPLPQPPEGE